MTETEKHKREVAQVVGIMMSECGMLLGISKKPNSQAQYSKTGPQQNLLMLVGTPAVRERRGEKGGKIRREGGRWRGREGERRGGSREKERKRN